MFDYLNLPPQQRLAHGRKKVVVTRLCPPGLCINLLGYFFTRNRNWISDHVINHEQIHTAQIREMCIIPFYLIYLIEWLCRYFQYRNWNVAYRNISFEREAYAHGDNLDYLTTRRSMAWMQYLKKSC